jgi:uncharacterized protein (TIGR02444 family)
MAEADAQSGSPFWRFSLRFYRQPGVADACIALQDGCGVDVNLLLFLLWLATAKRGVAHGDVEALYAKTVPWRDDVVAPLRTVRRKLKAGSALVEAAAAEFFRTRIKAVELEAERLQQEALFALAASLATTADPSTAAAARANVAAYERVLKRRFPPESVDTLLSALQSCA